MTAYKIVKALHVTPTQRKIIDFMLANGCNSAHSKRISATMSDAGERLRKIVFDQQWIVIIELKP